MDQGHPPSVLDNDEYIVGKDQYMKEQLEKENEKPTISTLEECLNYTKLSELTTSYPKLVYCTTEDTLSVVLEKLLEHQILSLPVYNPPQRLFVSFIDLVDICYHFLQLLEKHTEPKAIFEKLRNSSVKSISDVSGRNPFNGLESSATLKVAINFMIKYNIYRIPILDSDGELRTLLTQTSVIKYVSPFLSKTSLGQSTIESLKLGFKPVFKISIQDPISNAFKLITTERVSGVAIVDQDQYVGSLSVSDLRLLGYNLHLFEKLFLKVEEFIKLVPESTHDAIQIPPSITFSELCHTFERSGVHRAFIVDDAKKILGVVSLSDLIRLLQ
eukprot:TRINITY_DN1881_c0_g1_i1.p1 TRINITY_DN1881_c0_g1~~TRINITY_DN1881_c0_g1_i1.p1  ORF type:complete len:348 (-),score=70.03 TRINITY_DN1881_c0_g1_i1:79-1065(-)